MTPPVRPPLSILLGTRNPSILKEARAVLEPFGWEVRGADSDELRATAVAEPPTLALVGFDGLGADAIALTRDLLRSQGIHRFPVLLAAQDPGEELISKALSVGAADVVDRPVRWGLLLHRVQRILQVVEGLTELQRWEASLLDLQRIARLGSWILDRDTRLMRWSEQMYSLLGLDAGAKTDFEAFSLCIHPEDREAVCEALEEAAAARVPLDAMCRIILASGAVRYVQLRGELSPSQNLRMYGTMQDVTEQRRAQEKIRHLANFDSLTGLANRRRFIERLERARISSAAKGDRMALLYLDLDQFKRINDTLGHTAGDELLRSVADVLFEKVRSADALGRASIVEDSEISRLGGDEFAVLLTRIDGLEHVEQLATRILDALPAPIVVEGHEITTTGSIGIAVYPEDGEDVETLVKHADRALYHAKERGRNGYQFFSEALNVGALKRLTMEARLRSAVESGGLHLCFQPRLDLAKGRLDGVEALLRWDDEELGRVSPKDFIPLAEETGLILELGAWVIRAACAQGVAWRASGLRDLRVSVNVSTIQFRRGDLVSTVGEALTTTGFDPKWLEIEITESLMLQDDEDTATVLRELRAMGIRIALDDFGTGYSSLSYLSRYPLDVLKLDRSLVRDLTGDPHARGIATAVISMAHVLGLSVVAEGVDQEEQLDFLREQGCDEAQGFLIAGPLEKDEVLQRISRHPASRDAA